MTQRKHSKKTAEQKIQITLTAENTENLRFAAKMSGIEPERIVNEWLLLDLLREVRNPGSGALRDLIGMTVYYDPAEAEEVKQRVADWERAADRDLGPVEVAAA